MAKLTVLYDLGVLVHDNLLPQAEALAESLGRGSEEIERAIAASLPRYQSGAINQHTHWELIAAQLGLEESELFYNYAELGAIVNQQLLGRVRVQSPQMQLGLVSDATPDWVGHWRKELQLDRLFAAHIIESDLFEEKSYAELLTLAAERLQRPLAEVWFVDDKPEHLVAAKTLGMPLIDLSAKTDYAHAFAALPTS